VYLAPDTWAELMVQAVAPGNAVTVRIQLIHTNFNVTGTTSGAVFWDDATLIGPGSGLSLVWADEFNGATLDLNNWSYETGYGNNGWGNDEWQEYTSATSNVSIVQDPGNMNNSFLNISAQCPTAPVCGKRDGSITSARINTSAKFEFRFGRVEARIQVPGGLSSWPAFWMLGAKFPVTGWPKAGEIDILEVFDNKSNASSAMHWCDESLNVGCSFPNGYRFVANSLNTGSSLANAFHVFEMEWDANGVTTSVDGTEFFSTTIQPATMEEFLDDFFLILNVAIGGNPVTNPGPTTTWPQTMLVDYVRVYQ
jgi:beta-glucanase (GH16 family)